MHISRSAPKCRIKFSRQGAGDDGRLERAGCAGCSDSTNEYRGLHVRRCCLPGQVMSGGAVHQGRSRQAVHSTRAGHVRRCTLPGQVMSGGALYRGRSCRAVQSTRAGHVRRCSLPGQVMSGGAACRFRLCRLASAECRPLIALLLLGEQAGELLLAVGYIDNESPILLRVAISYVCPLRFMGAKSIEFVLYNFLLNRALFINVMAVRHHGSFCFSCRRYKEV